MTRNGITICFFTVLALGCGDGPQKRPIGGVCTDDGDCSSGLCSAGTCLDPSADDDLDGLVNGLEVSLGSDPQRADTDGDGRPDGEELVSLANVDTDGDGKADVLESAVGDADDDCVTDQYDADDAAPTTDTSPMIPIVCRLVGVCAEGGLSVSCETGEPACVYTGVIGFADPESACDGADDDCDGDNDDGFADRDADGVADCVDVDWDNDGIADASDVCPEVADPAQADADDNGIGDACAGAYGWRFGELPPAIAVDAPFEASGRLVRLATGDGPPPPTLRGGATLASSPALVERALTPVDNVWSLDDLAFDTLGEYTLTVSAPGTVTGTSDVIEVVAGPLCRLVASGPATVVAGAPFDVSVTARDAGDHDRVGRAGAATFELGCAGAVPSPGTAPFVDGVATMRGIVATAAGACSVTARVDGDAVVEPCALATTHALTVEPTSADRMELVGMPEAVVADVPVSLTLRVLDGYGNLATGYRGTVTLASDDALALLPAPIALDEAAAGDAEVVVRLRSAGAREVSAADAGTLGARASTLVTAGPATRLVIDAPAEVTAGVDFGVGLSARDAFDNVATGFAGAITLTSDDALATLPSGVVAAAGAATANGLVLRTAGTVTLGASGGGAITGSRQVVVRPGLDRRLVLVDPPTTIVAGEPVDLHARVEDLFGNLDPAWQGALEVVVDDAAASLPDPVLVVDGEALLEGVVLGTAGTWLVTVRDPIVTALFATFSLEVEPGPFAALAVSCAPASVAAGETSACAVRAEDALGNLTPTIVGAMAVSVSDAAAVAPASVTLAGGLGALDVAPRTVGVATVEVRSATTPVIVGSDTIEVTSAAVARFVVGLAADTKAGVATAVTVEARDAFDNRVTGFVGAVPLATSDARATLASSLTFVAADLGHAVAPVTFGTRGAQTVTAQAGDPRVGNATTTVRAGAPAALRLDLAGTATAGIAKAFGVTIEDAFGNVADDPDDLYTGVVTFSMAAPEPDLAPTLPAPTTFGGGDLGARELEATWYRAGSWHLHASGAGLAQGEDEVAVVVGPGALDHLVASGPGSVDAGEPFDLEVVAEDAWDNPLVAGATIAVGAVNGCTGPTGGTVPPAAIGPYTCTIAGTATFGLAASIGDATASVDVVVLPTGPASVVVDLPTGAKAGVGAAATVRVYDAQGNLATGFGGTITITTDDALAVAPESVQAIAGVASFDVVFGTVGTRRVSATLGALGDDDTTAVRAGAPHRLTLTDAPGDAVAGQPRAVEVRILDAYGNTVDDASAPYEGSVTLSVSGPAPSPAPDLPGALVFDAGDAGVMSTAATWYDAGTWTLRATGTSLVEATADLEVTVVPGAAADLVLTGPDATPPGVGFDVFVRVEDAWANLLTAATSVTIGVPSGCTGPAEATVPPTAVSGFACTEAGPKTFTFTAGALSEELDLDVDPSAPASVELVLPATAKAGVAVTVTARARDNFGNVASGYGGNIGIACGDTKATCPSSVTASAGEATFEVTFGSVGSQSVTASIGTFVDPESTLVRAGAPHELRLTDAGGSATAGVGKGFTLTIVDAYGNRADDPDDLYLGTVTMSVVAPGPDLAPTLPSPIAFVTGDASQRASSATWFRAGGWTLRATGTALGVASDDLAVTVVPGAAHHLDVAGPASALAGASFAVDVEVEDEWDNVRASTASVAISYPAGCTGPSSANVPPKTVSGLACTESGTKRVTFTTGAAGALTKDLDVAITPLAPSSVELVLPGTAKAGVAVSATARARDTHGNIAAGYNGAIGISCGDAKATCPSSVTANAGVATFDVTFGTVGSQSVTVTLSTFNDSESATVRAGAPHHLELTDAGGSATAGVGKGFTVTIVDSYGNRATDPADLYLGTVTMSVVAPGPDPAPSLPSPLAFTSGDASQRTSSATWYRAGTWTLRATGTSLTNTSDDHAITVVPGAAHHLDVAGPASVAAGTSFSVDVEVEDEWNNVRTSTAAVSISYAAGCTGPASANVPPKTVSGITCTEAGTKRLTFTAGALTKDLDVPITPLAPSSVELVLPGTAKAGVAVSATARARDTHGNVSAGYNGAIGISCGDAKATCPSSVTASAGVATFDVTFGTVGSQSVTVTLSTFNDSESATVRAGAPHHIDLTDAGGSATAGVGKGFTVTIVDSYGNRANDPADLYLGTVTMSVVAPGPDLTPSLPSPLTFTSTDASQRASSATWYRAGAWTLRATGTSLTGTTDDLAATVVAGAAHHLDVSGPASVGAGSSFAVDVEVEDEWNNVRTSTASVAISYPSGCTGPSSANVPPKTVSGLACTESGTKRLTFNAGALTKDLDVEVTALEASSVELVLPATAKAGVAVSATARARDAQGNIATGFNGTIDVACGDTLATCPSSVTASAGEATFDVTFGSVGSQSVTVTLDTSEDSESATVRAGSPYALVLTDAGGDATAGVGKGFTLTIVDIYGNRADDPDDRYLGTVTMSVVAPDPDLTPSLPSPLTFVASDASQRTSSATWYRAGAWTLRGTGTGLEVTTDDLGVAVVAGAAHHLGVSGPASVAAGESFSVDVEVQDEWDNPRTATASVAITYAAGCSGPSSADVPPETISGIACTEAGTKQLTFTAGALSKDLDVEVTSLEASSVELVLPTTAKAGVAVSATARARDSQGNVATGFNGTIEVSCGDAKATCPSSVTASAGEATFDVTFGSVGSQSVTVTLDTFEDSESATVRAGSPHHIELTATGATAPAGVPKNFIVTIVDSYGNRADDPADLYLGTVTLSVVAPGPNPAPSLPGPITFLGGDYSRRTVSVTWYRAGVWTLRATGTGLAVPSGDLAVTVVAGNPVGLEWVVYGNQSTVSVPLRHLGQPLAVEVVDNWGNRVSSSASVGAAIAYNDGRGRLTGTTTVDAVAGVASFDTIAIDRPGRYALVATSSGLVSTPDAGTFTVWHEAPKFAGPPEITVEGGCVSAAFMLSQPLSAPVDLELRFAWPDPETGYPMYLPATVGHASPTGLRGVATSPQGVWHEVVWDASADVPRDAQPWQYVGLELQVVARIGGASDTVTAPVPYDPSARPVASFVEPPENYGWAKAPPLLWDFDGDGLLDLARYTDSNMLNQAVSFVMDVGGARVPALLDLPYSVPAKLYGRARLGDDTYDALWHVSADGYELQYQPYRASGPHQVSIADGWGSSEPCAPGIIVDAVAADFDLDGNDELAIACALANHNLRVLDLDQEGYFDVTLTIWDSPKHLAVIDWQHDGVPDLVAASDEWVTALVRGDLTFDVVDSTWLGPAYPIKDMVPFDGDPTEILLPRDGIEDLAIATGTTEVVWLSSRPRYDQDGEIVSVFGDRAYIAVDDPLDRLAAADVDADGRTDLLGLSSEGGRVVLMRSIRGDEPFLVTTLPGELSGRDGFAVGDTDRDRRPEVAFATEGFAALVDFVVPPLCRPDVDAAEPRPGGWGAEAVWADADGDGFPDAIQVEANVDQVMEHVFRPGLGRGLFGSPTTMGPALEQQGPVVGDFDGDGRLDAAYADSQDVRASLRQPDGTYVDVQLIPSTSCCLDGAAERLLATDLDGDGLDDVLIASNERVLWYQNLGALTFASRVEIARWDTYATSSVPSLHLRDVNHDGLYEVSAAIYIGSQIALCWWLSDESGWPTDPHDCVLIDNGNDSSFALDASIDVGRPAILELQPDWEGDQTHVRFHELPSGSPTVEIWLPGVQLLTTHFTMRHTNVTGERVYTLVRTPWQEYGLLSDVAGYPNHLFTAQPQIDALDAWWPEVEDVDGDRVVDLVLDGAIYSGRGASQVGQLPEFEAAVPFSQQIWGFNADRVTADFDGNGYVDAATFSFGSGLSEGGQGSSTSFAITWTDAPDVLRGTTVVLDEIGVFGSDEVIAEPARMPMPGLAAAFREEIYVFRPALEGLEPYYQALQLDSPIVAFTVADLDRDGLDELIGAVSAYQQHDVFLYHQEVAASFTGPIMGEPGLDGVFPHALATGYLLPPADGYMPVHIAAAVQIPDLGKVIQLYRVPWSLHALTPVAEVPLPPDMLHGVYGLWVTDVDGDRLDDLVAGVREPGEGSDFTLGIRVFRQRPEGGFTLPYALDFLGSWGEWVLGLTDLDRDGAVDLVTYEHVRWGRHKPELVDFGPPSAAVSEPWSVVEWPWRGRASLLGFDRWMPVPDGAGVPGYGP